ncbi:hypothetical protein CspeluHIS016_0301990 [Cutaneotrichosporon spelunceum]|uniref:ThuA-like domain-containing protein n=1 Tax=Cutaneotrichosporon spelunceum TaxID=1672016 RepID=A0AAD3TTL5_9TREE|nr:hypothetical protein CspeluHIS016_0301990 [Cutaneotrichosporon spelunceum]
MRLPVLALALAPLSVALTNPRVLVYTRTLGYRHDSIPTAIETLHTHGPANNIEFEFTEDPMQFTDGTLSRFDGLLFVSTSEEVLDGTQQDALARYLRSGGVYAGVHSASACLYNDSVYLHAVGAYFDYHPSLQPATFLRVATHPATDPVPDRWRFAEEVYYWRQDPRDQGAAVLLTVEEGSYVNDAGSSGNYTFRAPHPIAWCIENPTYGQEGRAGRSFYTSLGHTNETWTDETFIAHVFGGLKWALDGATTRAYGAGLVGNNVTVATSSSASGMGGTGGAGGTAATTSESVARSSSAAPVASPSSSAPSLGVARAAVAAAAGLLTIL